MSQTTVMTMKKRIGAALAGAALLVSAGIAGGATQAEALQPNTVFFPNLAACNAAKGQYSNSFTRITQGCTYSGSYFLGVKLSSGPYFLVYTTRTS